MRPLALSGRAVEVVARTAPPASGSVLRLTYPSAGGALGPQDAVLVKSQRDTDLALATKADRVVAIDTEATSADCFGLVVRLGPEFGYLAPGDILGFGGGRNVRALYRHNSRHNSFLVTERCNHWCLMCSQPPRDVDDGWVLERIAAAIPLIDKETRSLGFTGGEPLLNWRRFLEVLRLAKEELPSSALHVLTNGRAFAEVAVARAWADLGHPDLMAGIPIYSCVDTLHDYVVQARGAFDETVLGVLRLKNAGGRIEIRVVLHKITVSMLVETALWIARNLPFVDHVALMGLENTGFALANQELLWIDPFDYQAELAKAVDILTAARLNVSIYNLPFCVLDPSVWPFARQSISDWKNGFVPQCEVCAARSECAGFFTSGRTKLSRAIVPLSTTAIHHSTEGVAVERRGREAILT